MSDERMVPMTREQRDAFVTGDVIGERGKWTPHVRALVAAFDAAPASDPRFAQIRDLLAVWAGEGSKIGEAHAIASAAAAAERDDPDA